MGGIFSFGVAVNKAQELQKMTGRSYNECSSALHLADGDMNKALKILRSSPEHDKRIKCR